MTKLNLLFSVLAVLMLPVLVSASTIVRTGGSIGILQNQVVEGDFYAFGDNVTLSGQVTEDILAAGARVILNGEVGGDALIVGATVDINGPVNDDVRVVGTAVSVSGEVNGNLVVVAQTLKILSSASIKGDVLFYGGSAEIAGTVGRDVLGRNEVMRIDGPVMGAVNVRSQQVTLGDQANISGDLRYESTSEVVRSPNAVVAGNVTRSDGEAPETGSFAGFVLVFLISIFATLVFYLLLPGLLRRVGSQVVDYPVRSTLIGVGTFFLLPIAGLALLASTLGLVVGGVLLSAFIAVSFAAYAAAGALAGVILARIFKKPDELSIIWIVSGTLALHMLMSAPYVGVALLIGLVLITLGALVEVVIRQLRNA